MWRWTSNQHLKIVCRLLYNQSFMCNYILNHVPWSLDLWSFLLMKFNVFGMKSLSIIWFLSHMSHIEQLKASMVIINYSSFFRGTLNLTSVICKSQSIWKVRLKDNWSDVNCQKGTSLRAFLWQHLQGECIISNSIASISVSVEPLS